MRCFVAKPAPTSLPGRLRAWTGRFAREKRGVAAIEFALVAIPFFMLLFGILELALVFVLSTALDNATDTAARQIRTGRLAAGASATTFRKTICDELGWLSSGSCVNAMKVDVRTYPTFSGINLTSPIANGEINDASLSFSAGQGGDIVVVRAFYAWPIFTPLLTQAVSNLSGGKRLVTSTIAFRNEPF